MKLYTAAVYSNNFMANQSRYEFLNEFERQVLGKLPNILESYHYVNKVKYVESMRKNNAKIFLDSGAFSAYTLNTKIYLAEYCNFIKNNLDVIKIEEGVLLASVLDDIKSPLKTYQNQLAMERLNIKPLPCFHLGEDPRYLEYYIANYNYITIGGMLKYSTAQLIELLDTLWEHYLVGNNGFPKLKIHGFGITNFSIVERYPWHSVDSSSWVQAASFGNIVTPKFGNIAISNNLKSKHIQGQHASTLTEIEKKALYNYLENNGFNYERLCTSHESRATFNLWAYGVLQNSINAEKALVFKAHAQKLFL